MTDPYRDSLTALYNRRRALVTELEQLDNEIRARAAIAIPCFRDLSRWKQRKLRKAWQTVSNSAPFDHERCAMYHMEPCPFGHRECGAFDPKTERKIRESKLIVNESQADRIYNLLQDLKLDG